MKYFILAALLLGLPLFAQEATFEDYLKQGKDEFKKPFGEQDYISAITALGKALEINPNNAEAHYFYGCAIDYDNSSDGNTLIFRDYYVSDLISREFETALKLQPKYSGEINLLDPYSKITSTWGSLALAYLYNNKTDSAKLAFKEGKKRGGFSDFLLEFNRYALDLCNKNSIYFVSGDDILFPLMYLQLVDNYRTDVTLVDIDLLGTYWYPKFLMAAKKINFNFKDDLDSVDFKEWQESLVSVKIKDTGKNFEWMLKPSYEDKYILRGDILMLNILQENQFVKDIYFNAPVNPKNSLNLEDYLQENVVVFKLITERNQQIDSKTFEQNMKKASKILSRINENSTDEKQFVEDFRHAYLSRIYYEIQIENKKEANILYKMMNSELPQDKYPVESLELKQYIEELKKYL